MTEVQHEYGGDVGENPVTMPETARNVTVQAGLASASAVPGEAEAGGSSSGVD